MIDLEMLDHINARMPKFNKSIIKGLAVEQMNQVESYINEAFRCAAESFPPGLTYVGGVRCTPMEQFKEITRALKPIKMFELSRSDIYLMRYHFRFNGIDLRPQHIFLPFISDGGLMYLNGTQYQVTPVLSGRVFNVERGNIYMRTPRMPMGFWHHEVSCVLNDKVIHTSAIGSYLFHIEKPTDRSKLEPCILHYNLAEYGLTTTLKKFFGVDAKIGNQELEKLPKNEWMIYSSRQLPPVIKRPGPYEVSTIRIAVPAHQHYELLNGVIATIFYIIDNSVESTKDLESLENPQLWLRLLYNFIFKEPSTEKKLYERMESHLSGMKNVMDPITKRNLLQSGIHCETFFDLVHYLCINYQDLVIHYDVGTMYNKELTTVKYVLYNVVYNIFKTMYELQRLPPELLTPEKITKVMITSFRKDTILSVRRHGELTPVSIATDCKPFSATCNAITHSQATVTDKQKNTNAANDLGLMLHESQAECSTYQWITGHDPVGRSKINPFIVFKQRDYITPNAEIENDILAIRELLHAKIQIGDLKWEVEDSDVNDNVSLMDEF